MKSLFPPLKRRGLTRLLLRGTFHDHKERIFSYWHRLALIRNGIVCLDKTYKVGKQRYAARLFFNLRSKKKVSMIIDVGADSLPMQASTGKLTDGVLLDFCRWLDASHPSLLRTHFMMTATSFSKFAPNINLPFSVPGKSDVYISGIKYGFSDKRLLHSLAIEIAGDQLMTDLVTKPVFKLNVDRFNEHFFDAVLERAVNPVNRAMRPVHV